MVDKLSITHCRALCDVKYTESQIMYGTLLKANDIYYIINIIKEDNRLFYYRVIDTSFIDIFTGFTDNFGKDIYTGDTFIYNDKTYKVQFADGCFEVIDIIYKKRDYLKVFIANHCINHIKSREKYFIE